MQIDTLEIYCDVARLRSFSRAAEANGVLQATASLTVQRLEKHLGATLIDRSCRPWKLTRPGRIFYDGCREVLEGYYALESEVRGNQDTAETVVRVAAIYSVNLDHELQAETLVAVPFSTQKFVRSLGIVYRRGRRLYPNARAFVELLQNGSNPPGGEKPKS